MPGRLAYVQMIQYLDDNAEVLANGFVYTYDAGTSTPKATYQDYQLATANTNPVQLDAAGRARIWYGDGLYKVVVTDSQGTQIYSEDYVPGDGGGGGGSSTWPGEKTSVASNTLVDLGAVGSNFAQITGTVTVNSFGSSATTTNPIYLLTFNNALTITNSASVLVRAGVTTVGNNLVTASGDYAFVEYLGSGVWKIFEYCRGDGSFDATSINCGVLTVTTTANLP